MDLIRQFPDISMRMREEARMKRSRKEAVSRPTLTYQIEQTRAQKHEREFRKWHLKLFVLIIIVLASFYFIILNSPWMFNLVNSIKVYVEAASLRSS